jgi:hypothetical protein
MQHDRQRFDAIEKGARPRLIRAGLVVGGLVFCVLFFFLRPSDPSDNLMHFVLSLLFGFVGFLTGYSVLLNALLAEITEKINKDELSQG